MRRSDPSLQRENGQHRFFQLTTNTPPPMKLPCRLLNLTLSIGIQSAALSATFDWQDKPEANHEMAFRLFVPDGVASARAVIALTPGFNGDGRGMAEDPAWQAFAKKNQCVLLACSMKGDYGGQYYEAEKWSGKVMLEALKKLAPTSGHPEIAAAPIALWGHSAGGQFNFNFACWKPERTLAFVANKGGYYGESTRPSVRKIPGMWILGAKDTGIRVKNITSKYEDGRKQGAIWALAVEPNEGHGVGRSRDLGMVFLEECLAAGFDNFGRSKPFDPGAGWLGNPETKQIEKNATGGPGPKTSCWFPGERTATLWVEVEGTVLEGHKEEL
jgi:dienelactone hydrolase